jgi:peptide/nickel transport system permease protein
MVEFAFQRQQGRPASAGASATGEPFRRPGHNLPFALLIPVAAFSILIALRWLVDASPTSQDLAGRLRPPVWLDGSWSHPLGTDGLGRDVLARVVHGATASLRFALVATSIAAAVGLSVGVLAGYAGGWFDRIVVLLSDLTLSIPAIILGIVLTATIGQNGRNLIVILAIQGWVAYARVVRLQVRQLARSDFVDAARSLGASRSRIAFKHLTPHVLPTAVLLIGQQLGGMMLWESSLTYLGIGASPETITLGSIVRDGQEQIFTAWWISFSGGFALATGIIGFGFLGDWFRHAFDRRIHIASNTTYPED